MNGGGPGRRSKRLDRLWPRSRPAVMGILNCTPDSFSDGGRHLAPDAALRHAKELIGNGASIVDVGGESTRPGAAPVTVGKEIDRVVPVIAEIRRRWPEVVLSIDTSKIEVAREALSHGADMVNDVTGGGDPSILDLVAAEGAGIVLMHMRGEPRTMQTDTAYDHAVAEVHEYLRGRAAEAVAAGVASRHVWLDPGIGFAKLDDANLALLAALPDLAALGHPVLAGPSNKSFIGRLTGAETGDRLPGTLAALIPLLGVSRSVVRVHDAAAAYQFLEVAHQIREARP